MSLVGREREQERLAALGASGGSLLVVGEPGVGKSALLRPLDGHLVTGVEAERDLPYSGLHQVLHPFLDLSTLSGARRDALEVVFGLSDGAAPPVHLVGLAALDLLSTAKPVVLVDDAHWLDQASQDVLGFVARRLSGATLIAAARIPMFAGVPALTVEPLAPDAADTLLCPARLRAPRAADRRAGSPCATWTSAAAARCGRGQRGRGSQLAEGEHRYDGFERKLQNRPVISVPAITIASDFDGPNKSGAGYRDRFTGRYEHRILDGIGHNVQQEAPEAFTRAVLDVSR
ncbi:hypothetical protein GCM10022267_30740 [Lentzea roselyniae]|uniref:Orc1-like AAA ATPase domain-containing protein n=1 Tax=Lentzea roselyniae TaxID=531940 RepID=A0ABP7AX72_9PSEU